MEVLRQLPRDYKLHVHAYQGSTKFMNAVLTEFPNSVFGISGALVKPTVSEEALEIARQCPVDRMMLESDAPFLCGEPREIPLVAMKLAKMRSLSVVEVLNKTTETCEKFFDLKWRLDHAKRSLERLNSTAMTVQKTPEEP